VIEEDNFPDQGHPIIKQKKKKVGGKNDTV